MASPPLLEFRDVRKHYVSGDDRVRAVDGLTLKIEAGELVALYGPSGSGKSTLLRIAAGIEPPDAGEVLVAGVDVTKLSAKDGARYRMYTLGWVHQEAALDEGATVLENAAIKHLVAASSVREGFRRVTPLLHELRLGHRLDHRADTLSAGERQRVTIAQALSLDPQVLLADEPTGSLDFATGETVMQLMFDLNREVGTTLVLVTHDKAIAARCDRQLHIEAGHLVES